jgi:hypothetical protein
MAQQQQPNDLADLLTQLTQQGQRQHDQYERHQSNKRKYQVFAEKQAPKFNDAEVGKFIAQLHHLKPPTPEDAFELLLAAVPAYMKQRIIQLVDHMKVLKNAGQANSTWDEAALNEVILQTQTNSITRQVDAVKRGMHDKKRTLSGGTTPVRLWLDTLRNDFQILQFLKRIETWTRTAPPPTEAASTFPPVTSDQSQDEQNSAFLRHVTRECLDTDLSLKVEAGLKAQGATHAGNNPRATGRNHLYGSGHPQCWQSGQQQFERPNQDLLSVSR